MFYPLLKAITNFVCGANFTSADIIDNPFNSKIQKHIFMTVYSFGCLYSVEIYTDHVKMELLKVIDNDSFRSPLNPITSPEQLSIIYSLLKIFHPKLYETMFSGKHNKFDIDYLKSNLDKIVYRTDDGHLDVDMYLGIFALHGFPKEGGTLVIDGEEVTLKYDDRESNLELIPYGVDWAYMGRGLWLHMCQKIQ